MYKTLLLLINKLPKDSHIIFVGDLIDRGEESAKVIKLVRDRGYQTVLGNHENTMLIYFHEYFSGTDLKLLNKKWSPWLYKNGGKETLQSYNIWENDTPSDEIINYIKNDLTWIESLPLFIELKTPHKSNKKVVVSHSNITKVWHLRESKKDFKHFKDIVTRTRDLEHCIQSNIFNIYGHTIRENALLTATHINVDTGCYLKEKGNGKLTAYCIEEDSFIN
jgi:serine/threonine protein phosphatase 1